ncbi:hypothetical protein LB518_05115 [Mesorhizobium sp. BR1-1-16]|uniref:hypothetical protein n=1 Tax=Mesorhizobium sp. BR1-1-16 TaxID=2876653 RepID=UPI001CCB3095|nr:hypothetical protein [Mesorhizobium sp. BR1-1-16]MBZ9935660.1 hypothetical protein [Mesorhizobium sp. BR1-1-16]
MAGRAPDGSCADAVRALLDGRWEGWAGLPADCSLVALDRSFGGSTELDHQAVLGDGTQCIRAALETAPVVVWHTGGRPLLVECDLTSRPRPAPEAGDGRVVRLDVVWGASVIEGGEIVMPDRGLAIIAAPQGDAVGCLGFEPMPIERYLATRRPRMTLPRPQPQPVRITKP